MKYNTSTVNNNQCRVIQTGLTRVICFCGVVSVEFVITSFGTVVLYPIVVIDISSDIVITAPALASMYIAIIGTIIQIALTTLIFPAAPEDSWNEDPTKKIIAG